MTPEEVRELRVSLGLTQEQLAEKINVNRIEITRWETGKHKPSPLLEWRLKQLKGEL